ncbi:MAG TPA: hypothetical protein VJ579_01455 [Candidatus Paceibacterota bacterium]|nr:hypothetical protein [Candidatus Paceibacterota bacterium]
MEIFTNLTLLNDGTLGPYCKLLSKQLYWFIVFLVAFWLEDVDTLMEIVYDDKHILPRHAHALAGKATLSVIRRYVAHQYMTYRILRDVSAKFRHSLYDIWLLLPELRPSVDAVRKELGQLRSIA